MNYAQKQLVECINDLVAKLPFYYCLFPKDFISDIAKSNGFFKHHCTLFKLELTDHSTLLKMRLKCFSACLLYMFIIKLSSTRNY